MARKKKNQKQEVREINEEASALLHTASLRPMNQHQLRNTIPSNGDEVRLPPVIRTPFPSHPSAGPPSPHTQEAIAAYHAAINYSPSYQSETRGVHSEIVGGMEEGQGGGRVGGSALERVKEMVRNVNVVLGLTNGTETLASKGDLDSSETEHGGTSGELGDEGTRPPLEQQHTRVDPKSSWVNLFRGPQLTGKGNSLSFIAPTILEGTPVAMLDKVDMSKMAAIWDCALIMYVVGDKPSIGAVIRYIDKEWGHVGKPNVFLHDEGYFVVKFCSKRDRDEVLVAGPHTFFGRPMITKPWSSDFNFQEEILRVIPVWVKLPNLPLCCWGMDSLSRIGSLVGVPLFADECTSKQLRISFARLLIEVDVTKSVTKVVQIQDSCGRTFNQKVEYEWLPPFCKECQIIGHDCSVKKGQTRYQPATHVQPVQKKVTKVWKPKKVVNAAVSVPEPAVPEEIIPSLIATTPLNQAQVSEVQDDGWRVVSRRRRESKHYDHPLGLAQVPKVVDVVEGFSIEEEGEDAEVEEGDRYPP